MYKLKILATIFFTLFLTSLNANEMFQTVKNEEATLVKEDSSKGFVS